MPNIRKQTEWSSHSRLLPAGALLGLLLILATGGCDGNSGTGGGGGGGQGGSAGEGGSAGTAVEGVWHEATLIEHDDTGDAQEPRLAGSRGGNAVAVWLQWDGERNNVWANTYDSGTGWQTDQPIEHEDGDADAPQVAVSPSGRRAMAVWSQVDDSMISNVWVNRHATGWRSEGTILDLDNGWLAFAPQVVVYDGGSAKVVWYELFRVQRRIWTNRFTPSADPLQERWWGAERIETDTDNAEKPALVGYEGAGVTAAWREADGFGHVDAWASRYDPVGLDWETSVPFGNADALLVDDLNLVADAGHNVMAVWHQVDGADNGVWANRYDVDWGWGDPEPLEADTGVPPLPEVAMDPAGNAIVVWAHWDDSTSTQNIMAKRYEDAGGWQAAEAIDEGTGDASTPHVAVDPAGNAMAVWQQRDDTIPYTHDIWASHYDAATGQWAEPELVETRDGPASAPRVSLDADGNALAVWRQWDDTLEHNDIWANRWAPRP